MQKYEILKKIVESGVVAVIRGNSMEQTLETALASVAGGISSVEITYTAPGAGEVIGKIKQLSAKFNLTVGAGTVLDSETARAAILAGADYIVAPAFNRHCALLCNRYGTPYIPGCMTPKEIIEAREYGVDMIKLFPANVVGPEMLKALKAPLPGLLFMPTGGISPKNLELWFRAGADVVGAGGGLTAPAATENYEQVTERARELVRIYRRIREEIR